MNSHQTEIHCSLPAGRLEENAGTGLLNVKEEDETDDMNSHQTEMHWSLPVDEDNADKVKVEITEDLCVTLGTPDEETSYSFSSWRLEENPGTGLLNVKEEDETDDMNSHQTAIHCSLPADEDKADIVKVEITEYLCVRHQLEAPGRMDVSSSDDSAAEHRGEPYVCDYMKTEEDEIPINTATGDVKTEVTLNAEQTNDLQAVKQEIGYNICTGDVKTEVTPNAEQTNDLYVKCHLEAVKQEISDNISTGEFSNCSNPSLSHGENTDTCFNPVPNHRSNMGILCSEFGNCFARKSTLITHQKIHTGEKVFACSECGKYFTKKSNLITHQKIHTGEKAFSCSECGKCFTEKSNLTKHQKIHTGEKAFSCSECGKCFAWKSNLITHQKTHRRESIMF
ncbi:zinc finger protein 484-like [Bombina bombina]|uniref:zinc finger protein 484-like n=1 Tax=Bombina bombina TaxID=8345 RepID=UPI00235ACA4A|nr:zinc finger protein 484-like [Bombina bombina]